MRRHRPRGAPECHGDLAEHRLHPLALMVNDVGDPTGFPRALPDSLMSAKAGAPGGWSTGRLLKTDVFDSGATSTGWPVGCHQQVDPQAV